MVRQAVVEQEAFLDELVNDEHQIVREKALQQQRALDESTNDSVNGREQP